MQDKEIRMKNAVIRDNVVTAVHELTVDELDQVSGGWSFLGGFGSVGGSANVGPINAGASVSHGGPNGDFYSTVYGGGETRASAPSAGFSGGPNVAFGFGDHTFKDVVEGSATVVNFGIGSVSYSANGFTIGLNLAGTSGFGVTHAETTNLTNNPPATDPVQPALDALNGPDHSADLNTQPVLNDWSTAFGDHELHAGATAPGAQAAETNTGQAADSSASGSHGTEDPGSHVEDPGSHADPGSQPGSDPSASGSHGTDDGNHGAEASAEPGNNNGGYADYGNNDGYGGNDFGNDFGDSSFSGSDFG
jgi:hypothetical protein